MAFLALMLLGAGTLIAFSAYRGRSPAEVLRAVLRGDELPGTRYVIEAPGLITPEGARGLGEAAGDAAIEGAVVAGFARPLSAWKVTSGYGMRWGQMHEGVDVPASTGTPIRAAAAGVVDKAGWAAGAGNRVNVKHNATFTTKYFHMSRVAVRAGQSVAQGQVIGYVGSTGRSSGPHLHFEVWRNGRSQNPAGYVK